MFVGGFFEANTHFITLTLIKNTWPYSRGQSEHKSARRWVGARLSGSAAPPLLRSWHPGLHSFNCGAALGSVTAAQRGRGRASTRRHAPPRSAAHTHTLHAITLQRAPPPMVPHLFASSHRAATALRPICPAPPPSLSSRSLRASPVSSGSSVKWEINLS